MDLVTCGGFGMTIDEEALQQIVCRIIIAASTLLPIIYNGRRREVGGAGFIINQLQTQNI
jgi:hypothetical protein